jgi:hypothetical protein
MSKLQFLIKKRKEKIQLYFFPIFGHQTLNPDSFEMLDPFPDPDSINPVHITAEKCRYWNGVFSPGLTCVSTVD